jgi:HEAT repeat protein
MPQRKLQQLLARLHPDEENLPDVEDELIALGEKDPDRIVAAMLAVEAAEPIVRETVVKVLGGLGSRAKAAIPFLAARLRDGSEDGTVRMWAANSLGQMQTESHAILLELCRDADPYVRYKAANELGNIGIYAPAVVDALLTTLADPVELVRGSARDALARIQDTELDAHLSGALKHPSASVRVAAAHALLSRNAKDWAALQTLADVIGAGPPEARVWACEALSLAKEAGVIAMDQLRACLGHKNPPVRAKAAWALSQLQLLALPALTELGQALHDSTADIRFWSAHALMRLDELAEPVAADLVQALQARIQKGPHPDDAECFLLTCLVRAVGNIGLAGKDGLAALKAAQKETARFPNAELRNLIRWSIKRCQGKA